MPVFIKNFAQLNKSDTQTAGGKGASLGEMTQVGIPVPAGFVVLSDAFEYFIDSTGLNVEIEAALALVKHDDINTVEKASEKIKSLITNTIMPEEIRLQINESFKKLDAQYVAVRSSATAEDSSSAAWAGQLESYLNTTKSNLFENVQKCWASLFTPRAIFYRFEKKLHNQKISVAVVIQKMIQSEVSGIAFSVHPVTEDYNQMIIEASYGLGEAIVSGQVTPDSYVIEKNSGKIIEKMVQEKTRGLFKNPIGANDWKDILQEKIEKQALTDEQILELSELIIKIENHYNFPVDIEWALYEDKFYMVQSRPITTLSNRNISLKQFNKEDYLLAFWVQGVSIFVTDIHAEVYRDLEALFIIDQGMFKQYFTNNAYKRALVNGVKFYSDKVAYEKYEIELKKLCQDLKLFFELNIKNKVNISRKDVIKFFEFTKKLCGDYTKMNFEFTDKAFIEQNNNLIITKNLEKASKFKDFVRAEMNIALFEPEGYSYKLFNILSKQFSLEVQTIENLTQYEILNLFENKMPDANIIKKRQKAFAEGFGLDAPIEGAAAEELILEFKEDNTQRDKIYGQTANKGFYKGSVKIIPVDYGDLERINKEIAKMKNGEILVAETTAPEVIVACKKAGAIITDMGGLMSHAAIVSREFGIPCVVGTKNASKILRDGDLIEVDADNGLVKNINKNEPKTTEASTQNHKIEIDLPEKIKNQLNQYDISLEATRRAHNYIIYSIAHSQSRKDLFSIGNMAILTTIDENDICSSYYAINKNEPFGLFTKSDSILNYLNNADDLSDTTYTDSIPFLRTKPKIISKKNLWKYLESFYDAFEKLMHSASLLRYLDRYLINILKADFTDEEISLLCAPLEKSFSLQEEHEIQKYISKLNNKNLNMREVAERLSETYGYLSCGYYNEKPHDEKYYENILLNKIQNKNQNNKESSEKKWHSFMTKKMKLYSSLKEKHKIFTQFASHSAQSKDITKARSSELIYLIEPVFEQISALTGYTNFQLKSLIPSDMKKLIFEKNFNNINKPRVYVGLPNKFSQYDGLKIYETKYQDSNISSLSGRSAFNGKVRGKVRKIRDSSEFSKVAIGDILVVYNTTPDFVPLLKKVNGIIAEEGGITAHVSVISREFEIPALVGVKNAMQIIHDGDLVEVNANEGIIKIIK